MGDEVRASRTSLNLPNEMVDINANDEFLGAIENAKGHIQSIGLH